jgi:PAS domain-containing protein
MINDHEQGMLIPIIVLALFILVVSLLLGSESPVTAWLVNGFAVFVAALYYGIRKYQYLDKVARLRLLEITKLEQTLAAIADTHWEWDLSSDAYDYHGSLASILGYTNHEGDKKFWKEVIHPVDRPMHKYRLLRHLEDNS